MVDGCVHGRRDGACGVFIRESVIKNSKKNIFELEVLALQPARFHVRSDQGNCEKSGWWGVYLKASR